MHNALAVSILIALAVAPTNAVLPMSDAAPPPASRPPSDAPPSPVSSPTLEEAEALIKQGNYADAESLCRSLLAEAEAVHGPSSAEVAQVLDVLVDALRRAGRTGEPETQELARRAVTIKEAVFGPSHLEVARSLNNVGNIALVNGDYALAKTLYERILQIREKELGPDHQDVGSILVNLGNVYRALGKNEEARAYFERALPILEKSLGADHPAVGSTLNNLGVVLAESGEYEAARPLYERALAIREKVLGPDHPDVARNVNNLANLLYYIGNYSEARPLYERALSIEEKALGPEHEQLAGTLNSLGSLLQKTGDLVGAKPLMERALRIRESSLGPDSPDVALSLFNLGSLHHRVGERDIARGHMERALAIWEQATGGTEHPEAAACLHDLAALAREQGDVASARSYGERALAIRERVLGPEHPDVAASLSTLGSLARDEGDNAAAGEFYGRALMIREEGLGPEHPDVAASLHDLADLDTVTGDIDRALRSSLRAESISRAHLRLTVQSLAEREALSYAQSRTRGLDVALSILMAGLEPPAAQEVWDAVIQSRALVLDEMADRHRVSSDAVDPAVARAASDLSAVRSRLANLTVRGPGELEPKTYRLNLDEARRRKEEAERELARRSLAYRTKTLRNSVGFEQVDSALPNDAALVAFVRADPRRVEPRYLAFVLSHRGQEPVALEVGTTGEIDGLVSEWKREIMRAGSARRVDEEHRERTKTDEEEATPYEGAAEQSNPHEGEPEHASDDEIRAERTCREVGEALRRRIWDPLQPLIGDAAHVFVVPDGALHLVNLAALPAEDGGYLIERNPLFHYLSSERDLVSNDGEASVGRGLLALGGPDYDRVDDDAPALEASVFRGTRSSCGSFESLRFPPLPASLEEMREVARICAESPGSGEHDLELSGARADEATFKRETAGKRLLHLATHGFFLGANCVPGGLASRGIGVLLTDEPQASLSEIAENPLLLSGLALAGANRRDAVGPLEEDGILTAEEIAALDLTGVEWAVLSACDTATGQQEAGEGVFGLQRAFEVAGTRTLIMSLWSVEDVATRAWMKALYEGRFRTRLSTAEAVREASRQCLNGRRARGESTHPFRWGAFIAAGDWR